MESCACFALAKHPTQTSPRGSIYKERYDLAELHGSLHLLQTIAQQLISKHNIGLAPHPGQRLIADYWRNDYPVS